MTDLGTLGGGYSIAGGINNLGQVTGWSVTSSAAVHAFLYTDGKMRDLGDLGIPYSYGEGINDAGQVTGYSYPSYNVQHAFFYSNGQMMDLNDLIDPALGITLNNANGISDSGQIVANSNLPADGFRAYLLTPVPEPSTGALLGLAGLLLSAGAQSTRRGIQAP